MTKFEAPSFSVGVGDSKNYRDNWERIFGKKPEKPDPWAGERDAEPTAPKKMSDLPPPREAQAAPDKPVKAKKAKKKNEKPKTKAKKKK